MLQIFRDTVLVASVNIDEATVFTGELMGADKITAVFYAETALKLQIGDFVLLQNKRYKIKDATNAEQIDSRTFKYVVEFYGEVYDLYDEMVIHLNATRFSYTGTPLELLNLLIDSMNSDNPVPAWAVGACADLAKVESFTFSEQSVRTALTDIAERFELEYYVDNRRIYLVQKIGKTHDFTLQYGRGKGLQSAQRQPLDKPFATVWYGFGGSENLPASYRSGADRLMLNAPIERNVSLYGRKKGSVTFEDVYPQRTGTITAVTNLNAVVDTDLDFDLNAQVITDAKIVFKSGELFGQEFVITNYNHTDKRITFGSNKDTLGNTLPNNTFSASVGDKYTLIGITMPQNYIDAAEAELLRLTREHAKNNSYPPVSFPLDIDEKYIREMGLAYQLKAGDSVKVKSIELGIWATMRLQSVSFPLVNPCQIAGVVSDVIPYTSQELIVKDVRKTKREFTAAQKVIEKAQKQAEEIANAAILTQFEKTYIGELAVLSGAFVVGNPESGQVGGVSGAGTASDSVTFFAGASFANKESAPFRVLRNGKAFATNLEVRDGCKIGAFEVADGVLYRRNSNDSFAPSSNFARIGDYFLFRKNGAVRGQTKEISFNLNSAVAGTNYAVKVENSITEQFVDNVALYAVADNANSANSVAIKAVALNTPNNTGVRKIAVQCIGELDIQGKVAINNFYGRDIALDVRLANGNALALTFNSGILI
jgi:hypothetical protein